MKPNPTAYYSWSKPGLGTYINFMAKKIDLLTELAGNMGK